MLLQMLVPVMIVECHWQLPDC